MSLDYEGLQPLAMFTATIWVCSHYYRTPPQLHVCTSPYARSSKLKQAANQNIAASGHTDPFRNSAGVEWDWGNNKQKTLYSMLRISIFKRHRSRIASGDFKPSHSYFLEGEQARLAPGFCSLPFFVHRKAVKWYVALHLVFAWKNSGS